MLKKILALVLFILMAGLAPRLSAQVPDPKATIDEHSFDYSLLDRHYRWQASSSIGATLSPDLFLFAAEAQYFITHNFSVGPLMQLAVDDHLLMFCPSGIAKLTFDVDAAGPVRRLKPFLQGGGGIALGHIDAQGARRSSTDIGVLVNVGAGLDFYLNSHLALTNNLMVNIISTAIEGHVFVSWQLLGVRYLF